MRVIRYSGTFLSRFDLFLTCMPVFPQLRRGRRAAWASHRPTSSLKTSRPLRWQSGPKLASGHAVEDPGAARVGSKTPHTPPAHLGDKAMVILEPTQKRKDRHRDSARMVALDMVSWSLMRPMVAQVVIKENFQARVLVMMVVARRRTHPGHRGTAILSETPSFKPTSNNSGPLEPSTFSHM